jgi:hypothetical protein
MKARRRVEFTGVELAAPVEKAVAGEGCGGREAQWRGRKTGYHAWAWWRHRPTEQRHDGEGGVVESAVTETAR